MMNPMTTPAPKELLDMSKRHKTFVHGDLTVIITWTLTDHRPCMVLIPTHTVLHYNRVTPCIVPDTMAWAWSEDARLRDVKHCLESSLNFAISLYGIGASVAQANKIATLIHDHIDDLIICPPLPNYFDKHVIGTVKRTDPDTGKVIIGEIREDV